MKEAIPDCPQEWPARIEPMLSPSFYAGFERLHAHRGDRLTRLSLPGLFPVDWLLLNRPFDRNAVDLFAEYQAAGKRMRASLPLVPHRPSRLASLHELQDQLELETCRMKNMLARLTEGVAGHFRIFDPGVRSPNLIQRVQLLALHERHHFKAMGHLIAEPGLGFQKKVVRRNGPQASLD